MLAALYQRLIGGKIELALKLARMMTASAAPLKNWNDVLVVTDGFVGGVNEWGKPAGQADEEDRPRNHRLRYLVPAGACAFAGTALVAISTVSGNPMVSPIDPVRAR